MSPVARRWGWLAGLTAAGVAAGVVAYWLASQPVSPRPDWGAAAVPLEGVGACDPTQAPCRAQAEGVAIDLVLEGEVRALQPFHARARVEAPPGVTVRTVEVAFVMTGMDMGPNRYVLAPVGEAWTAQARLPVCSSGRLDWVARAFVLTSAGAYRADFPFALRAP